jgi:two-component system, LuxR family, response regulator FixJ
MSCGDGSDLNQSREYMGRDMVKHRLMTDQSAVALLDADERRRARITYQCSQDGIVVIPCADMTELSIQSIEGLYLVHDDGELVSQVLSHVESHSSWAPVIAYSEQPTPDQVVDAMFAGALDYIEANFSMHSLRASMAKAEARAQTVRETRAAAIRARANMNRLTQREREVVAGMSEGLTNKGIARRLNISPRTVEIHRNNALGKMGAISSVDAVRMALEARPVRS